MAKQEAYRELTKLIENHRERLVEAYEEDPDPQAYRKELERFIRYDVRPFIDKLIECLPDERKQAA